MSSSMSMPCSESFSVSPQSTLNQCIDDALESLAMIVQINAHGSDEETGLDVQQIEAIRAATTLVEHVHRMRHTKT